MTISDDITEARVDAFVAAVNSSRREAKLCESIPELCRRSAAGRGGYCDWQIVPSMAGPWLADLASRLPYRWPPSFHSLISRYQFPAFCCGPLEFYSVGFPNDYDGLSTAVLRDKPMVSALWKHGLLPFARPEDSSYDPVCFDYINVAPTGEPRRENRP